MSEQAKAALQRLKQAKETALRRKLGKPLALSDAALDQAATVSDLDAEAAKAFWRANAPAGLKDLIEAGPSEST